MPPEGVERATTSLGRPVLRVRCEPHGHRVGEVHRVAGGLLWRARLPRPGRDWQPRPDALTRPPVEPGTEQHWTELSWHKVQLVDAPDYELVVEWGCRCTPTPLGWTADDLWEAAVDPAQTEIQLLT